MTRRSLIDPGQVTFLVLNYEQVWRVAQRLKKMPWDMVVADEAHRLRHKNSRQSKAVWRIGQRAAFKLALTGTPIGKDERDLWAQFRFLDDSILGSAWKAFEKKYMRRTWIGPPGAQWPKVRLKPNAGERITRAVADYVYSIRAEDALGLPPATDTALTFDLTFKAAEAYRKIENDFAYEFNGLVSSTPLAITRMLRLHQLAGGHLGTDEGKVLEFNQDKLDTLTDWLEDLPQGEKLVVFAQFTQEIDRIAALMTRVGRSYAIRDGRTSKKDADRWIDFQEKKHPSTYIAQVASGGIGVDLFAARFGVFYSASFSYIDYEQCRRRLLRNGQTRPVSFIHMVARNTIDEDLYSALQGTGVIADQVLQRLQDRRRRNR